MPGSGSMSQKEQQQESIPASQRPYHRKKQDKSTTIQDELGKCFTKEPEILHRWTEYCSDLYNGEPTVLDCPQKPGEEPFPILRENVEAEVKAVNMGKSAGVNSIPAELVKAGGDAVINVLTSVCNIILKTGEWPTEWTKSLVITLSKKLVFVPKLQSHQPHQPSKQNHDEDHPKQTKSGKGNCTDFWFQGSKKHHRANIQPAKPQRKVPTTSKGSVSCLHSF